MNKVILIVFALSVANISFAQRLKVIDEPLDHAVLKISLDGYSMTNLELQKELQLNEDQYNQVQQLNEKRYQKMQEVDVIFREDAIKRSKAIYAINLETEKALSMVLQPEQLIKFIALEGRDNLRFATEKED